MIHELKQAHKCIVCSMLFREKVTLAAHMAKHIERLPYECYFCEKQFVVDGDLEKHVKKIH